MTMTGSNQEDITEALHRRWEEIANECKHNEHKNRTQVTINYCHIQTVTLCKACYELAQEEHKILYAKLRKEGYRP